MGYLKCIAMFAVLFFCLGSVTPAVAYPGSNGICSIDRAWFLPGGGISEPDPNNFPAKPNNCDFHKFSWHYFLWLTQKKSDGKLLFEDLYSEDAVNPEAPGYPNSKNRDLHLVFQAGSLGILVDQHGRAAYTSMYINKTYRDFVNGNGLNNREKLQAFPAKTNFPVGSLSVKASWRILANNENPGNAYTTRMNVRKLINKDGKVGISPNPRDVEMVRVALVGLHIAIVVKHHPEAIWATFEQRDNAPNMYPGLSPDQPVSEKDYTFYRAGTKASDCNQNNAGLLKLDVRTQRLAPATQVCRQYPHGGGSLNNRNNIEAINFSAMLGLRSVWRNYPEIGAVWLQGNDKLVPNWSPKAKSEPEITGSTTLSSSVIETFTQNIRSQNDCFSCHNTMALIDTPSGIPILAGKNVSISHIVLQHYIDGNVVNR